MNKVFSIYPIDKEHPTKFLNKINTYLSNNHFGEWFCYKVKLSDFDHLKCIDSACNSNAKLIFFMGHGRSNLLYGSCGKADAEFIHPDALQDSHYKNEEFITTNNIERFKDKIFFSFSCNSNRNDKNSIGRVAIEKGILSFVGFGDIPTDFIQDNNFPKSAIAIFKSIITKVIKISLAKSLTNNASVLQLVDTIKLLINKEMQILLLSKYKCRHKICIIEKLHAFKSEILILGNRYEKIFD